MQGLNKLDSENLETIECCKDKQDISQLKLFDKGMICRKQILTNLESYSSYAQDKAQVSNNQINDIGVRKQQSSKMILILDDSIVENSPINSLTQDNVQQRTEQKIKPKQKRSQPLNPFQQILHEYDTPDFNTTLPFTDEFSKIQLKSPTFSDVLNLSELKSPQINHQQQSNKFFIAPKKCQKTQLFHENNNIDNQKYILEQKDFKLKFNFDKVKNNTVQKNEISLISTIKISKPLETPKKRSSQKISKPLTPAKIMSQQTYKIKNHQNSLTPKIKNISILFQQQNNVKTYQKFMPYDDESIDSNPQIEGKFITPSVSSDNVKIKISPRLHQSCSIIDNLPTKRSNEVLLVKDTYRGEISRISPYKKASIKKLQLQQELQEIYKGKFKLSRTMRF